MQALFEAVRQACSPGEWSRGVELSRGGGVVVEHATNDEVMLKISTRSGMISPTVTLWPEDKDWSCNCPSQAEVCAHVAAAVIALHHAPQAGQDRPSLNTTAGHLRYCFTRAKGGLVFERAVVQGGQVRILESSLSALAAGQGSGEVLLTTQADLAVELALGSRRRGWLPREVMPKLLVALARCGDVCLNNVPVKASATPVGLRGCVVDEADGFKLFVEPDAAITEVFANGIVLCGDTLRTVKEPELTAREREELQTGRYFVASAALELVTEVLPALRKRLAVNIRTQRLPQLASVPPRVLLEVHREGHTLTVLPTLVYGNPPTARVDAERLVHLGGDIPRRDEVVEKHLVQHLWHTLGLVPGHRAQFADEDAVRFAAQLQTWKGEIRGEGHKTFVVTPPLEPRLRLDASTFDLWFELASAGPSSRSSSQSIGAATVLQAWQDGASLVPLADGGWKPGRTVRRLYHWPMVAGPPCLSPGYSALAIASPTCWPRVPPVPPYHAMPSLISPAYAMTWSSRVRQNSPACRPSSRSFRVFLRRLSLRGSRPSYVLTSDMGSTGWRLSVRQVLARYSPTIWDLAKPCRRSVSSRAVPW